MAQIPGPHSFTVEADGILRELVSKVGVTTAYDVKRLGGVPQPKIEFFHGVWDTGATNSVISQEVVDKCGLKPIGTTRTPQKPQKLLRQDATGPPVRASGVFKDYRR